MKKNILRLLGLIFTAVSILFFLFTIQCSSSTEPSDESDSTSTGPLVRKPNIYIYPESSINLSISIKFPNGGRVIKAIPSYNNGWDITVDKSGKIDSNYDYLFYECTAPDLYQYKKGWRVGHDSLTAFFRINLKRTGFTEKEIQDFVEYWIPKLKSDEYIIYPQYSEDLKNIVVLKFSEEPDNLIRLFYIIQGSMGLDKELLLPDIPEFDRSGFHVAEWGVIVK